MSTWKIGASNSPVTMDFSTIQAWEDACPADITATGTNEIYIGECYDQGDLAGFTISGTTTDSTHYLWLRTATGASFRDNAGVRTNPLFPDNTKGVYLTASNNYGGVFNITSNYTRLSYLQMVQGGAATAIGFNNGGHIVDSCIVKGASTPILGASTWDFTMINCLLITGNTFGSANGASCGHLFNCTIVDPSAGGITGLLGSNYGATRDHHNCAVFGYGTMVSGTNGGTSDYGATDTSTGVEGAHTLSGLTFSSQFVSSTNDFRAVATGGLKAGTPDPTNAPVDITGQARDATTPYIGVWEVAPTVPTAGHIIFRNEAYV